MKGVLESRVPARMLYGVDDDDDEEDADYVYAWIPWFCQLDGHEFLAEVDEEYIRDRFNLFGLKPQVANFEKALSTILNGEPGPEAWDEATQMYADARDLYGLIHARFILSPRGLTVMKEKFLRGAFGQCPRVLCDRQNCLPVGLTDQLEECTVRLYCPKCEEVYEVPRKIEYIVDGAFFGTSFPHIFLQTYPGLVPLDAPVSYVPKVFGFRVHGKKSIIQLKCEMGEFGSSLIPPDKLAGRNSSPGPGVVGGCGIDDNQHLQFSSPQRSRALPSEGVNASARNVSTSATGAGASGSRRPEPGSGASGPAGGVSDPDLHANNGGSEGGAAEGSAVGADVAMHSQYASGGKSQGAPQMDETGPRPGNPSCPQLTRLVNKISEYA